MTPNREFDVNFQNALASYHRDTEDFYDNLGEWSTPSLKRIANSFDSLADGFFRCGATSSTARNTASFLPSFCQHRRLFAGPVPNAPHDTAAWLLRRN